MQWRMRVFELDVVNSEGILFMSIVIFFFFNDTATTEIYTLSLHDALPICGLRQYRRPRGDGGPDGLVRGRTARRTRADRKSTRLNSSHLVISYAVFCLKKKKKNTCLYLDKPIKYHTSSQIVIIYIHVCIVI